MSHLFKPTVCPLFFGGTNDFILYSMKQIRDGQPETFSEIWWFDCINIPADNQCLKYFNQHI